jgi:hypothetical protein
MQIAAAMGLGMNRGSTGWHGRRRSNSDNSPGMRTGTSEYLPCILVAGVWIDRLRAGNAFLVLLRPISATASHMRHARQRP